MLMVKSPCYMCPDRTAECHTHCEKWAESELSRNADYERRRKLSETGRIINEIESRRYRRKNR